ncbi:MAG: hypothetical protein WCK46_01505 [Candidatus Adlerbacteria bacterium]
MTVETVANILSESAFSPDIYARMETILKAAKERGSITAEEKARLLELVDEEEKKTRAQI